MVMVIAYQSINQSILPCYMLLFSWLCACHTMLQCNVNTEYKQLRIIPVRVLIRPEQGMPNSPLGGKPETTFFLFWKSLASGMQCIPYSTCSRFIACRPYGTYGARMLLRRTVGLFTVHSPKSVDRSKIMVVKA